MSEAYKLVIEDDEGNRSVVPCELGEVSIGRQEGSTIHLNERNVSRNHARIVKDNGKVVAEDLDSYNGVFINGDRIDGRRPLHEGDVIRIGDFQLELRGEGLLRRSAETTQRTMVPEVETTEPEIRVAEPPKNEVTPVNVTVVGPLAAPVAHEAPREESTAIIRVDHLRDLEPGPQVGTIAGEKPRLICVSTNFAGQEFEIAKTEMVIGRTDDNDIAIDHRSVSRHHTRIVTQGKTYRVIDLNSANGTLVNGELYAQLELKAGDLIELGHVKFRFVPPGATYTLSAEEVAAVQNAQPARKATAVSATDHKRARRAAPAALVAVLLAGAAFGGWWLSRTPPPDEPPVVAVAAPDPGQGQRLLAGAKEYMTQRQWDRALQLVRLALEKDAANTDALVLLDQIESERQAQRAWDEANAAIRQNNWGEAWNALNEVPPRSAYQDDSAKLKEQVRGALVSERLAVFQQAVDGGRRSEAADVISEIESLAPQHPEIAQLKADFKRAFPATQPTIAAATPLVEPPPARTKTPPLPPQSPVEPAPKPKPKQDPAAAQLYKDGVAALQAGQTDKAIDAFSKCVQVDRGYCRCYRAMGIAYARDKNGAKAARYYRLYLKTCPDASDAAQVEQYLKAYDGQ